MQKARCIAIDWLTSLALAFSFADRKQKKEQEKREEEITSHWNEIANAIFYLRLLLNEMCYLQRYPIDKQQSDNLKELILLFPMAEILSLQGFAGPVQEQYLRNHINIHQPRYNLKQFLTASIDRESIYPEWNALCGLSETHCGEIWHTLIEIICRLRTPEKFQETANHLGAILYHFWFLDHSDMEPAQIRYQNILSNLNMYAARDQDLPYLHAVMFLQRVLSEKYGGELPDYFPKLTSDQPYPMDGTEGFLFEVRRKDDFNFRGTFAVRKTEEPHDCDLVWEISPRGGSPTVLFSE